MTQSTMEPLDSRIASNSGYFDFIEEDSDEEIDKFTISLSFYVAFSAGNFQTKSSSEKEERTMYKNSAVKTSASRKSKKKIETPDSLTPVPESLSGLYASCEYILSPFSKYPTKMDLLVDSETTKIQVPGKECHTITNWCENSLIWTSWTNSHSLATLTDNFQNFNQEIDIALTTDPKKVTSKFKTEKSKMSDASESGNVKNQVEQLFEIVKKIYGKHGMEEIEEKHAMQKLIACSQEAESTSTKLKHDILNELLYSKIDNQESTYENKSPKKKNKLKKSSDRKISGKVPKENKIIENEKNVPEKKYEFYSAKINFAKFIMGLKGQVLLQEFLTLSLSSSPMIEKAFVKVEISEGCCMTEDQLCCLNPLLINIKSARDLPLLPHSFESLRMLCEPCYVSHCFLNEEQFKHKSHSLPQLKKLVWDDSYVIFLGQIDQCLLKEYFFGPGLEIEVHDRDLRKTEKAVLFGYDEDDASYNSMSYISYTNFLKNKHLWNPGNVTSYHGRALCNLSDILLGRTSIKTILNITNSPIPNEFRNKTSMFGNYVTSESILNIEITLHHPFVHQNVLESKMRFYDSVKCPFSRIILRSSRSNKCFLKALIEMLTKLNSAVLGIDSLNALDKQILLSTYKLSEEQISDPFFDIITGFHLCDTSTHVIILEGLACGLLTNSIYHLIQSLANESIENQRVGIASNHDQQESPINPSICDATEVKIMHHSNMTFQKRLYSGFNLNNHTLQLKDAISDILSQPLIHTRDLIPHPCYSCLLKIQQIQQASTIVSVARNNAFPTFAELSMLTKEFSGGICSEHIEILKENFQV